MRDDDFCLIHGNEHMKSKMGNPIPYCEKCEEESESPPMKNDMASECCRGRAPVAECKCSQPNEYAARIIQEMEEHLQFNTAIPASYLARLKNAVFPSPDAALALSSQAQEIEEWKEKAKTWQDYHSLELDERRAAEKERDALRELLRPIVSTLRTSSYVKDCFDVALPKKYFEDVYAAINATKPSRNSLPPDTVNRLDAVLTRLDCVESRDVLHGLTIDDLRHIFAALVPNWRPTP